MDDFLNLESLMEKSFSKLSFEEEKYIFSRIRMGDISLREKFILDNIGLSRNFVSKYKNVKFTSGIDFDDLVQVADMTLIDCVDGFDLEKNVRFSTYAISAIGFVIFNYINKNNAPIRISENKNKIYSAYIKVRDEFVKENGFDPSLDDIVSCLDGVTFEKLSEVVSFFSCFFSLDEKYDEERDDLGDYEMIIPDLNATDPLEYTVNRILFEMVEKGMNELSIDDRKIFILRSGYYGDEPMKLSDIGDIFGTSKENIRQRYNKCLKYLRAYITGEEVRKRGRVRKNNE